MHTFELDGYEFIELYKLLKIMNWVSSGGEAKQMIDQGLVKVNTQVVTQRRKKLKHGDVIAFDDKEAKVL